MTGKTGVRGIIESSGTDGEIMAELEEMQSWTATELAAYAILYYGRRGECRETKGRPAAVRRRAHDLIARHGGQQEGERRGSPYTLPTPEAIKLVPSMRTAFGIRATEESLADIKRDYVRHLESLGPSEEYEVPIQDNPILPPTIDGHDELLVVEYLLQALIAKQHGGEIVDLHALRSDLEYFIFLNDLDPRDLTVDDLDRMGVLHDKLLHYRRYLVHIDGMRQRIGKPSEPKEDGAYAKIVADSNWDITNRLL